METRPEDPASPDSSSAEAWRQNEHARVRQLREDAARPLAVNLAEGMALSEFLSSFTGSARRGVSADSLRLRLLLERLAEAGIDYVLVGGLAVNA